MNITFIKQPPFTVDFTRFSNDEKLQSKKDIQPIAGAALKILANVFSSLAKAGWSTISNSGLGFRHIVLSYSPATGIYSPNLNLYRLCEKITYWAIGLVFCFAITSYRHFKDTIAAPNAFLKDLTKDKLNISHIKTKNLSIDVSEVPESIKVKNLLTLFDQINFNDKDAPGFMPESTRKEGSTIYTIEKLREGLQNFVSKVDERVAFLGTPPAYDTARLMAFYQQIENAVRYSLHKVNHDLVEFKLKNPQDYSYLDPGLKTEYKNLLENQARLVIDLAIAGLHCGARFMGESMTSYFGIKGETENPEGTLQDELFELLAQKRSEIAQRNAMENGNSTHSFGKYMGIMGPILAIPGSNNIIEHLDKDFDLHENLRAFFNEYTVDFIIKTVQDKIKKSQAFREKLIDWLRDQVGDWSKDVYENAVTEAYDLVQPKLTHQENLAGFLSLANDEVMINLETNISDRIQKKEVDLKEILTSRIEIARRGEFVNKILSEEDSEPQNLTSNGITAALMEWLLVSHEVLNPQKKKMTRIER